MIQGFLSGFRNIGQSSEVEIYVRSLQASGLIGVPSMDEVRAEYSAQMQSIAFVEAVINVA